jgi:fructose-1,6-bisphosphatase I
MSNKVITIERFIIEEERAHPGASGDFSGLLRDLTLAFKIIWREVSKAGLVNILGMTGTENIHGDKVKKLDVFADEKIYQAMDHGGYLCVMASEENEDVLQIPEKYPTGKYVLLYDPLDGSSNIDVNVNIGTIFSIYRRVTPKGRGTMEDCLQPGY